MVESQIEIYAAEAQWSLTIDLEANWFPGPPIVLQIGKLIEMTKLFATRREKPLQATTRNGLLPQDKRHGKFHQVKVVVAHVVTTAFAQLTCRKRHLLPTEKLQVGVKRGFQLSCPGQRMP